jgi:DNA-directed RNA polymerase sigma subunit (sigma70/sigma32)
VALEPGHVPRGHRPGDDQRHRHEVGGTFNLTRERIRQIEREALRKLQSLVETDRLGAVREAGDFT